MINHDIPSYSSFPTHKSCHSSHSPAVAAASANGLRLAAAIRRCPRARSSDSEVDRSVLGASDSAVDTEEAREGSWHGRLGEVFWAKSIKIWVFDGFCHFPFIQMDSNGFKW